MIEPGTEIVLKIEDGTAVPLVHVAAEKWAQYPGGYWRSLYALTDKPLQWVGECGQTGWLYEYGGYACEMPVCELCLAIVDPALAKAA